MFEKALLFQLAVSFFLETNQYFYISPYRGSQFEQRYSLSVKAYSQKGQGFQYGLSSHFWYFEPHEVTQQFDVSEAFVGFETQSWNVKLGRVLPPWGNFSFYSPVLKNLPYFSLDPLTNIQEGLAGAYVSYKNKNFRFETLLSPLFIPLLGGPRIENNEEAKHLEVWSRWLPPLPYRINIGEGVLPLDYSLILPKIKDVIFQNGGLVRVGHETQKTSFFVHAGSVIDPSPRLRIEERMIPHKPEIRAYIIPEFDRKNVVGIEGSIHFSLASFISEAAYERPKNSLKTLLGMKIENISWLSHFVSGFSYEKELAKKIKSSLPELLPQKSPFLFFTSFHLQPFRTYSLEVMTEVDSEFKEGILRGSVGVSLFESLSLALGLDVLWGEDETYWGKFRGEDRMWVRGSYVF